MSEQGGPSGPVGRSQVTSALGRTGSKRRSLAEYHGRKKKKNTGRSVDHKCRTSSLTLHVEKLKCIHSSRSEQTAGNCHVASLKRYQLINRKYLMYLWIGIPDPKMALIVPNSPGRSSLEVTAQSGNSKFWNLQKRGLEGHFHLAPLP